MSKLRWYETLLSSNINYRLYTCNDNSHLIMDTGPSLQVLDAHSQLLDITKNHEKTWVPILPGFTIFTNIKNSLFQLSISVSDEQKILFSWVNFEELKMIFMTFLLTYAYSDGRVSLPHLLGLNIPGIVQRLVSVVY